MVTDALDRIAPGVAGRRSRPRSSGSRQIAFRNREYIPHRDGELPDWLPPNRARSVASVHRCLFLRPGVPPGHSALHYDAWIFVCEWHGATDAIEVKAT
jgi:hypothetical protein